MITYVRCLIDNHIIFNKHRNRGLKELYPFFFFFVLSLDHDRTKKKINITSTQNSLIFTITYDLPQSKPPIQNIPPLKPNRLDAPVPSTRFPLCLPRSKIHPNEKKKSSASPPFSPPPKHAAGHPFRGEEEKTAATRLAGARIIGRD